ncbi:filamin-A-like X3, partial [Biomphalaria pfeifferi]
MYTSVYLNRGERVSVTHAYLKNSRKLSDVPCLVGFITSVITGSLSDGDPSGFGASVGHTPW